MMHRLSERWTEWHLPEYSAAAQLNCQCILGTVTAVAAPFARRDRITNHSTVSNCIYVYVHIHTSTIFVRKEER